MSTTSPERHADAEIRAMFLRVDQEVATLRKKMTELQLEFQAAINALDRRIQDDRDARRRTEDARMRGVR